MATPTATTTIAAAAAAEAVPAAEAGSRPAALPAASVASLYVGDLAGSVDESVLIGAFSQVAPVATVRVCRDTVSGASLGYGYVNFHSRQDAVHALQTLNFAPLNGKNIRLMFSNRDPSTRKSGRANVFVKNLEASIDSKNLYDMFSSFGTILSCKVATDPSTGQSKGYGFVQYESEESAQDAINRLNGMLAEDRKIFVGLHMRRQNREAKFTNVYIKNLPAEFTDDDLRQEFEPFGGITSVVVMRHSDGASKCFGFVNFEKPEYATEAVQKLNGKSINDKVLYVGRAQKKAERQAELRAKFQQGSYGKVEKPQGINLYLKNIDDSISNEELKKLFEEFGEITSCTVMVDSKGRSKGSGFVSFTTAEAGHNAINGMNGKMVANKPLYVGLHQPKDQRRAMLTAHFAQRSLAMAAAPYAAPQQVYFGHPAPGQIPPQAAVFGFPQPLVPGMGPGAPVMMPHHMQRPMHPGQRMGARPGAMSPQMYRQQQMMIRPNANQGVRYAPNARNRAFPATLPQGFPGAAPPSLQQDGSSLTGALASASPEDQQQMLGNKLYPLVEQLDPVRAGKVTGMLLEMDKLEILHLLESPEALRAKVSEAMVVLQRSQAGASADPAPAVAAPSPDA
ncbi:hypothetical protein C2845_PM09G17350 [Panicum miliaceum]|uniref:Polyadenylate-binding protein n=1 Tax=Panicum miliaceum TaxID=4540 RepID=A0A3L6RZG8_PANMI|nr:hypothetical protein C2845_PM09G17350 [Panicum miliaceum]